MRRWSTAGRRVSRTQSASSRASRERGRGIVAGGASRSGSSARLESALATQPDGDGTLIPRPLSSHTKSSGTGRCWCAACAVVLSAACAVAWFSEASPKLQTTIASPGQAHGTPSLRARSIAIATPTARGRCEAMVEVCGMTASSWWPKTLCRPPAIGSSIAAVTPSMMSGTPSRPDLAGAREVEGARAVVEQRRVGRAQRERDGRVALVPGRADRVEAAALLLQPPRREVAVPALDLSPPDAPRRCGAGEPQSGRLERRRAPSRRCCSSGSRSSAIVGVGAVRAQPKKANGRTTSESIASSHTTAPPGSTSPWSARRERVGILAACRCRRSGASTGGSAGSPPTRAASRAAIASWRERHVTRTSHGA